MKYEKVEPITRDHANIIQKIKFHRSDKHGFLHDLYENNTFSNEKFSSLIRDITTIKEYYRNKTDIPRTIASLLFSINSVFQSIIWDVDAGKYEVNISQQELFDYWEELNFAIQDFFDDVNR